MNPDMHKMLRNELSADRVTSSSHDSINLSSNTNTNFVSAIPKKPVLQRMRSKFSKDSDDEVYVNLLILKINNL